MPDAEQVQDVEAGSGLNVEVAARVMGWTRWDIESGEDCPCEQGVTYFADWGDMGGVAVYTPPHLTGDVEYYFDPAGDIGDAWKVVEAMKARQWHMWVGVMSLTQYRASATFSGMWAGPRPVFYELAESPSLALCHAALKCCCTSSTEGFGKAHTWLSEQVTFSSESPADEVTEKP